MAYGKPIPSNQHAKFICTKCGKQWSVSSYATGGSLPKGTHAPQIPTPTAGGSFGGSRGGGISAGGSRSGGSIGHGGRR